MKGLASPSSEYHIFMFYSAKKYSCFSAIVIRNICQWYDGGLKFTCNFFFLIHSYLVSATLTLWKEAVNGELQLVKKAQPYVSPSSSIYWHLMFSLKLKNPAYFGVPSSHIYASQLWDRSVQGSKLFNLLKI